ncbi:MAG: energy transducer TonB [Candidatus Eremiobacteraeota bacterium]|nr:energy transducer TonB [Candidatus Eremiobacteraeota bacterium]
MTARKLWDDGTALLGAHKDDAAPSSCQRDEYEMTRFEAFAHGLRVGYQWAGMTLTQAVSVMGDFQKAALAPISPPQSYAYRTWSKHADNLWKQSQEYADQLKILLHQPNASNCSDPNVDADGLNMVTPDFPNGGGEIGGVVVVKALVNLDALGKLTKVTLQQSSANPFIDNATLQAARFSTYLPKIQNCIAVPGTYLFTATFDPSA